MGRGLRRRGGGGGGAGITSAAFVGRLLMWNERLTDHSIPSELARKCDFFLGSILLCAHQIISTLLRRGMIIGTFFRRGSINFLGEICLCNRILMKWIWGDKFSIKK